MILKLKMTILMIYNGNRSKLLVEVEGPMIQFRVMRLLE